MPDLVDRLGAALLDAGLAATAIAGLVVLAMLQCRQPARRRDWARAGLISTLALLPLAALNPVSRFDLRGPIRSILPMNLDDPAPRVGRTPPTGPDFGRPGCPATAPCGISCRPRWPRRVARGFVGCYLAGASVGLGWMALGLWGSSRLVRGASACSAGSLACAASLPFEGRGERPRLLVSPRATRPVLLGVVRPVVLIPPGLDRPGAGDRLRLSLLHEFAHAECDDHRFGPAAMLAQAIWFFLPPVWWARDQMRLDQEFLADRRAVAHFGTSGRYASSLVDLASSGPPADRGPATPPAGPGVASALFQRVLMLLRCPFAIEGRSPLWWRWSTAATLGLATLAASCLTLRGLAGWADAVPSPAAEPSRAFRLARLVIDQGDQGQPFDLRFRLPEEFTLTLEVMAEPADLSRIEVLGHPLAVGPESEPSRQAYRLWHRVRVRRSAGREEIRVDDRPVADPTRPIKPAPWLTIRPLPGQTARIRELELTW